MFHVHVHVQVAALGFACTCIRHNTYMILCRCFGLCTMYAPHLVRWSTSWTVSYNHVLLLLSSMQAPPNRFLWNFVTRLMFLSESRNAHVVNDALLARKPSNRNIKHHATKRVQSATYSISSSSSSSTVKCATGDADNWSAASGASILPQRQKAFISPNFLLSRTNTSSAQFSPLSFLLPSPYFFSFFLVYSFPFSTKTSSYEVWESSVCGRVFGVNTFWRILGSQNASHGNIFSRLCATQMLVQC